MQTFQVITSLYPLICQTTADFESMLDLSGNISSSVVPRWQRKQQRQAAAAAAASGNGNGGVDRFIPHRQASDSLDQSLDVSIMSNRDGDTDSDYSRLLQQELQPDDLNNSRVLAFKKKAPEVKDGYQNSLKILYSQQTGAKKEVAKPTRHIPSQPIKILDAPDVLDDYYLNLLSWSSTNTLAVALSQSVYLWDAATASIVELMSLKTEDDYVSSVSWIQQGGSCVAIGTASNEVQLWDVQAQKKTRVMNGHSARVGALAWNNHLLTSGGRDNCIFNHDVRVRVSLQLLVYFLLS